MSAGRPNFRFIDSGDNTGAFNMAVDRFLLEDYAGHKKKPVFRIYGWNPPCFSIGLNQKAGDFVNTAECRKAGIDIVGRMTGGGVFFHDNELTYSLALPADYFGGRCSVKETYRRICGFILLFYRFLGLSPVYAADSVRKKEIASSGICHSGREEYDILINGVKLGGNAQRRTSGVIFQHGSIPISFDRRRMFNCLLEKADSGKTEIAALSDYLPEMPDTLRLKELFSMAFCREMNACLEKLPLSGGELGKVNKYKDEYEKMQDSACCEFPAAA